MTPLDIRSMTPAVRGILTILERHARLAGGRPHDRHTQVATGS